MPYIINIMIFLWKSNLFHKFQNISEIDSLFVCLVCTYIDKIRLILVCSNEVEREREEDQKGPGEDQWR